MSNPIEPTDGYTYPEKLALVSNGLMAPETVGCANAEEAQALQVMPDAPKQPHLGDFCTFEVSEVPHKLRALWAKQDSKIINTFDEAAWLETNKDTHLLQARLRCGNVATMIEQTYTDVVLGFAAMLKNAGVLLETMKAQFDTGNFTPPTCKDPLLQQRGSIEVESKVVQS